MILIERLLSAKKTYFESEAGNLYAISDTVKPIFPMGLRRSSPEAKDDDCLALIDGPGTKGVFEVSSTRTRMIYTAPLQDHNHHRLALGVLGVFRAPVYLMDGWSLQELMITGFVAVCFYTAHSNIAYRIFLSPLDITFNRLQHISAKAPTASMCVFLATGCPKRKRPSKMPSKPSRALPALNHFSPIHLIHYHFASSMLLLGMEHVY